MVVVYSIHPAIGVARLGDSGVSSVSGWNGSTASYFFGPEAPDRTFAPQSYYHENHGAGHGRYRNENDQKIRRQAARFRIYRKKLDDDGTTFDAQEITTADARIVWTVHLANKKAASQRFPPYHRGFLERLTEFPMQPGGENYPNMVLRNFDVPEAERSGLMIEAQAQIAGDATASTEMNGTFIDTSVKLADILTDQSGQLVVLGGHGVSKHSENDQRGPREPEILDGAMLDANPDLPQQLREQCRRHRLYNWDGWCDDTSDGVITASVILHGETEPVPVDRAWVIVAPPDYAAASTNPITLFDVVYNAQRKAKRQLGLPVPALSVSFNQDIYPLLKRVVDLAFCSDNVRSAHGGESRGNFLKEPKLSKLASDLPADLFEKAGFVSQLTQPGAQDTAINMPALFGGVDPENPDLLPPEEALNNPQGGRLDRFGAALTVTDHQRDLLNAWARFDFQTDWNGSAPEFPAFEAISPADQPWALDKAALDQCCGGSFHPGIEASYVTARSDTYRVEKDTWFRVADGILPGDLTADLAVPWQNDFVACDASWWPGHRPVSVPLQEEGQFRDWYPPREFPSPFAERIFSDLRNAGFVRVHPEDGRVYLDDIREDLLADLAMPDSEAAVNFRAELTRWREGAKPA